MSSQRTSPGGSRAQSTFWLRRPAPLAPDELRAVCAWEGQRRPWRFVQVEVRPADGPDTLRVAVQLLWGEPDLELQELDTLLRSLQTLVDLVEGCTLSVDDPLAIFVQTAPGQLALWGDPDTRPLPSGVQPVLRTLRRPTDLPRNARRTSDCSPSSEGELSDLLQALTRVGLQRPLLRTGAGTAVVHAKLLGDLVKRGVLGVAALGLIADLGRRALLDVDPLEELAERYARDGDRGEREAAQELLAAIHRTTHVERTNSLPRLSEEDLGYGVVANIGSRLLAHPSLSEEDADAPEWEDDLLGEDLLLLDADASVPESPVRQALGGLDEPARIEAARTLATRGDFAEQAVAALTDTNETVAGACGLLVAGAWPPSGIPGVRQLLTLLAMPGRSRAVRMLAAAALGSLGRPDAGVPLKVLLDDVDSQVARTAMRALGAVPGAEARAITRDRLSDARLCAHAIAAVADAGDVVAFREAAVLAAHTDPDVRRAAAAHLDRIGGRRAVPALTRLYRDDESWQVQLEAAGALARRAREAELSRLLDTEDTDVYARIVRGLGEADRADALGTIKEAAHHPRSSVREAAAEAFGSLGLSVATPTLTEMVGDANPDVRIAAIEALANCGDRRAVHALRRNAGRDDETGAVARRVLQAGWRLRQAPPDGRVHIRAESDQPLPADLVEEMVKRFQAAGLGVRVRDTGVEATGTLDPEDLSTLARIARVVDSFSGQLEGVRWSARDGMYALRRSGQEWLVSGRRGSIVRDAGWFEETLPAPSERPPLVPIRQASATAMAPLPIAVVENLGGREQVRMEADPDRAADPDEITGEVPRPDASPVGVPGVAISEGPAGDAATVDRETGKPLPRTLPRTTTSDWDDLLSETRSEAAFASLAERGLADADRAHLRDWLSSGLPGLQLAACRVARLTRETNALPAIRALAESSSEEVRVAVAETLQALGVGTAPPETEEERAPVDDEASLSPSDTAHHA